jgi:hypothetical protein
MALKLVLLNNVPAGTSALGDQITHDWLTRVAAALQVQLRQHVAPAWPYAADAVVRVGANPGDLAGEGETPASILPTLQDVAPGAEAFHDVIVPGGQPDQFLALDECQTLDDITKGISHENNEITGDPECDQWVTIPSGIDLPSGLVAGGQIAIEDSDPLQDRSYPIDLGDGLPPIMVSDFCYPAYFDTSLPGPTSYGEDKCGMPRLAPFGRTAGGYHLFRNADGSGETQLFGMAPPHRAKRAKHHHSRWYRRGVRIA